MSKSTALLLPVVAILAGTSLWSWRAFLQERARADALQAGIEFRESATAATTEMPIAAPVAAADEEDSGAAETPSEAEEFGAYEARLLRDESYREARRRFRELELASGHIDLARVLGIPQETADRLLALLVDRELRYLEQRRPNPRNEEEMRVRRLEIQQAQHEEDVEIAALIGEAKLAGWKEYQASLPDRHQVQHLGAKLFAIGEPLREDQVEPLISAMYSKRPWIRQDLTNYTASLVWSGGMEAKSHAYRNARHAELTRIADERMRTAVSSMLSSKQFEVFDAMLLRDRDLQEARFQKSLKANRVNAGSD